MNLNKTQLNLTCKNLWNPDQKGDLEPSSNIKTCEQELMKNTSFTSWAVHRRPGGEHQLWWVFSEGIHRTTQLYSIWNAITNNVCSTVSPACSRIITLCTQRDTHLWILNEILLFLRGNLQTDCHDAKRFQLRVPRQLFSPILCLTRTLQLLWLWPHSFPNHSKHTLNLLPRQSLNA